jgi:hypothetical protein
MGADPSPPLEAALAGDFDTHLQTLLLYGDKTSMAWSVESRMPFMDWRLVEFLAGVPAVYKIHDGWTKWLARSAMSGRLPDEVTWRRDKMGWAIPEPAWFDGRRGPLAAWLQQRIDASSFARDVAGQVGWDVHRAPLAQRVRLLNLAQWHRLYFEEPSRPAGRLGVAWRWADSMSHAAGQGRRVVHVTTVHPRDDIRIFRKECVSLARAGYEVIQVVGDGLGPALVDGRAHRGHRRTPVRQAGTHPSAACGRPGCGAIAAARNRPPARPRTAAGGRDLGPRRPASHLRRARRPAETDVDQAVDRSPAAPAAGRAGGDQREPPGQPTGRSGGRHAAHRCPVCPYRAAQRERQQLSVSR